jgi:transcriptional regulator with XRE-family HTH domain
MTTEQNPVSFGELMRSHRKRLDLSQKDIQDRTRIERTSISRLEHSGNPSFNVIRKIAYAMGMTLEEFFRTAPIEAKTPVVVVDSTALSDYKNSELLIKTSGWPVPILKSETPLRSKVIEEKHIAGYFVIDQLLIPEVKDRKVVIWPIQESKAGIRFCLINIEDTVIQDEQTYLVDIEGVKILKARLTSGGALILDAIFEDSGQPLVFWGRQKERIDVLGKVVLLGMDATKSERR